jgi:predicted nucleotidyltransferase
MGSTPQPRTLAIDFVRQKRIIVRIMRTDNGDLAATLWPAVRRRVLGLLLGGRDRELHLREIARQVHLAPATVQREVARLTEAGILERRREGRQVYYRANQSCPIFPELRGLILKTVGLAGVLRRALESLHDRVELAFLFGSVARGDSTNQSDVDLMVIGRVTLRQLAPGLRAAQATLGREVNPTVMSVDEVADRAARADHFIASVLAQPRVFLIGGEDDLSRLAESRSPRNAPDVGSGDR